MPALEVTAIPVKEICAFPCLKTLRRRPILLRCVRTLLMIPPFVGGLRLTCQDHYKSLFFWGNLKLLLQNPGLKTIRHFSGKPAAFIFQLFPELE
jgi:hypothetical protein